MSQSFKVFIKSALDVSIVRDALERSLNIKLVGEADDNPPGFYHWSTDTLGLNLWFCDGHDYVEDSIDFPAYRYEIDICWNGVSLEWNGGLDKEYSDQWRHDFAVVVANILSKRLNCECIAVKDVFSIIAKFEPGD